MTMEDYSGSFEFAFFGTDYTDHLPFLQEGFFLMIKGKVQPKRYNQEEMEVKIHHISFLSELRDNLVTSVTLKVPISAITSELVTELADISQSEEGKVILKFVIFDAETKNSVQLLSRTMRLNLTDDFIKYIEEHPEISMSLG